jgi:tetratricopeptide (TPR) repeat protein
MFLTWRQIGFWKNSETLFKRDIEITGYNFIACSDLATYLLDHNKGDEALFYYEKALAAAPNFALAEIGLGMAQLKLGRTQAASEHLLKAAKLAPDNTDVHLNLALAYEKLDQQTSAIEQFRIVNTLRPSLTARKQLGNALAKSGDLTGAIAEFTAVAEANPKDLEAQSQLGCFFFQENRLSDAIDHYRQAIRLYHEALQERPDSPILLNNFAWLLATNPNAEIRNGPEAVRLAQKACELTRYETPVLLGTLAAAYAEASQFSNAVATATQAHDLAQAKNQKRIADRNAELLELYRANQPYHESGRTNNAMPKVR